MFKVGDWVKRIDSDNSFTDQSGKRHIMPVGSVHKVTEVGHDGWLGVEGFYSGRAVSNCKYFVAAQGSEVPTARANDPATSKGKRRVNKYEQAVLNSLAGRVDGMTGKGIAYDTGHPLNCLTPRFAPLRRKGLIKPLTKFIDGATVGEGQATIEVVKRDKQIVWVLA